MPEEEKSETSSSNKQHLKVFGFHSDKSFSAKIGGLLVERAGSAIPLLLLINQSESHFLRYYITFYQDFPHSSWKIQFHQGFLSLD